MATIRSAARKRPSISSPAAIALGVVALVVANWIASRPAVFWSVIAVLLVVTLGALAVVAQDLRRRLGARKTPAARYLQLKPGQFEQAIADLLTRSGAVDARVVGGAGDLGADVVARTPAGLKIVVQCKRYDGKPVGSPEMQQFVGTAVPHHHADRAVLVTTSRFTAPAVKYASEHGVLTVDGEQLAEWDRSSYAPWL